MYFISLMVFSCHNYSFGPTYVPENTLGPRYTMMNKTVMPIFTWKLLPNVVARQ